MSPTNLTERPRAQVNAAGVPFPVEVFIEAHPDDWQLFAGNQVASAAQTAAKVVIVYVTAGDAGSAVANPAFWQARETASKASVDVVTPPEAESTCGAVTINAHPIQRCARANVVTYYMHLPDGNGEGQGYGFGSLQQLRAGGIATFTAVDGTTTYASWADLLATMQALVATEAAGQAEADVAVHVHDWDLFLNGGDHSDHRSTGDLMREAAVGRAWNLFMYVGYGSVFYDPNLTPEQYDIKWQTIVAYDNVMVTLMGETIIGTSHAEDWAQRTIFRSELSNGTPRPPIPPAVPRAPTELRTAPVAGLPRLNLTWTDNANDEQGFRIERAPDAGGFAGTYAQIASVGPNITSYINTGLTADTRYWYRVRAYNAIGTSGYSNEQSGMVSPPIAPTALIATPNANGVRVDLRWTDNSNDEQGFRIERAPDVAGVAGTYVQVGSVGANGVTFSNSGLTNGTKYWFRVRAYNNVGTSAYTNEATATTLLQPTGPSNLVATAVSGVRIDLTWADNSTDETGFRIERALDVAGVPGTYAQIATVTANIVTYSNTGLKNGTRYWYRVRAYSAVGPSAYTNEVNAMTFPVPGTPSDLVATAISHLRIDLTWTDNGADETAYRIERAPDVGGAPGTFNQIASIGPNLTTYSNTTGLVGGTHYFYRVRAQNAVGNSPYSNIADATTLPTPPPNAPSALIAATVSGVRIDLDWTDNSTDEQGFRVERAPDVGGAAGAYVQIAQVGANVRSYNNTGLTNGTSYWYRVYAYNAVGPSGFSNEVSAATLPVPVAPTGLTATTFNGTRIDLAWSDNSTDETGFRIERAPDAGGVAGTYAVVITTAPNITTYSNTGLANGTRYWYRVRANNAVGGSEWTNEADATTLPAPTPPSDLGATAISSAVVDLSWVDNSGDETLFRIQRAPDVAGAPGTWANLANVGPNVTTYRSNNLTGATTYWYRVRAENAIGNSAYTGGTSVTTPAFVAPSGLVANAYLVGTQRNVDLTWSTGTELTVDVFRNGTRISAAQPNNGGPFNNKPAASLAVPISYQICAAGKTGPENCSLVVNVTF